MASRQRQILDAAVRVLGTNGSRGLTHRSVDAEAGLPPGSTSNYFRSRSALISGVVARLEERDYEDWERQPEAAVESMASLVAVLTGLITLAVTTDHVRTRTRYAIFVEAAIAGTDSDIARSIERSRTNLRSWGTGIAATLNLPEPERASAMLVDYLDGVIIHQLTKETFDADTVRADVERFITGLGRDEAGG